MDADIVTTTWQMREKVNHDKTGEATK